jgi:hypothetical protein
MSSRLNIILDGPELEHRILCDVLSLFAANAIALTDLQGYLPQLRNDMDEFILCHLLSFVFICSKLQHKRKRSVFLNGINLY